MKRFLLSIIVIIFSISTFSAQSKNKSLRTPKDAFSKDTITNGLILSKEIISIKGAVPKRQRDTLTLSKIQVRKSHKTSTMMRDPWEEVEPDNPVDPDPVDPVDPIDPTDPTLPGGNGVTIDAGRTPSTLDVSSLGGATYTIPIAVPPGIGKMVPQIALSYNSHAGKGIAGLGWNISGLSSISRIPTTMFHDSRMDGVNYDENDRFALDGQRLLLKSGVYGMNGAEYQTEAYSNLRIISHGASPFGNNSGPEYFEVIYPDGSKAFYGNSTDSRSPNQYALTYIENPLGARIRYIYNNNGHSLLISSIQYGSMGGASGINEIIFTYTYASRAEQGYIAGTSFYQNQILKKISVFSSMGNYRHYKLTHNSIPTINYDRLVSIQEFDGNEQHAFSPISLYYNNTGDVVVNNSINNLSVSGIASNNSEVVAADFTGNGSMDFLLYPKYSKDKFWTFYDMEANSPYYQVGTQINSGPFIELFPVTELTYNDKILAGQNIAVVKSEGSSYKFDIYAAVAYSPTLHQYSKTWDNVPLGPMFYSNCDFTDKQYPLEFQFLSGDFNGDGMTDIVAVNYGSVITYENPQASDDPYYNPGNCDQGYTDIGSTAYLINLDRRLNANFVSNLGMLSASHDYNAKLLTGDFNGDGKTDILQIRSGWIYVYGMSSNGSLQLLWSANDYRINNGQQFLPGDYNGDGKLDLMMATGSNSHFITFISTGKSFSVHEQNMPFSNTAGNWNGNSPGTLTLYYLIPNDVDGDGKTDIISAQTVTTNNNDNGSTYLTVYYAGNQSSSSMPAFYYGASTSRYGALKHNPIPVFLNPSKPNVKLEFGFMSNNSVALFKFGRDFRTESQVASINQDGVTHTIEYKSLDGTQNYSNDISLYQTSLDQTYPYVDLQTMPGLNVVSKLNRYYGGEQISQVFGYGRAVTHAEGLGFLGFGELIRSNWFVGSGDSNRNFTINVYDPQLRGALRKTFVTKYGYVNSSVKNVVLNNPPPASGIVDGASLSDYISRSDQAYITQLSPDKVFINIPVALTSKNMLEGRFSTETIEYDTYYNSTKITTNINAQGSKVFEVTYDNNPAANYIGRPLTSKTTLGNSSGSYTSEEEISYYGFLPTQVRKRGDGTGWISENTVYDIFGNVLQSTTTVPDGSQRAISMTYDPSGRFPISVTNADGLTSTATFDQVNGNKIQVTNPYGQTESYTYDSWGRPLTSTDYLGINTNLSHLRNGYNINVSEYNDEGSFSITTINPLGQTVETKEKNVLGQFVGKAFQYDVYGRQVAISEPSQDGNYSQWNTVAYDQYGRLIQSTSFTGKVSNISYNALTSSINDGTKTLTTTKNALDQVLSLQDPGGTVNYTYFPSGSMKSADYGGIIQAIEQDGWGRKTKLTDPSAGIYQYEYDGWGQLTKEVNPKGYKEYGYDGSGKIIQKKVIGDQTNMQSLYTYDSTTKLLTNLSLTNSDGNNTNYTYNYDSQKRISNIIEDNLHARFIKSYAYDTYGRVSAENYEAKDKQSNITVQKGVERQYQYGSLLQTSLQGTGQILWKISGLNAKGMLVEAMQGPALKNTYQYDTYGLPQQISLDNVSSSPINLMNLGYNFDAQRGTLNSRSNSAFNWNESFSYDSHNRLVNFNDNIGNNSQSYDSYGRILNNSQLGDYTYTGGNFRQTELDLQNNSTANTYYHLQHALQQITYNTFKGPVDIYEQGRERISFQYNNELGRSHMYFGDEQLEKMNRRFRRHYSESGDMEITDDMQTGKTSFVFYLSGDPYTAPAIWKEDHQGGQSTQNLYYLHRDHLGSVVMITNSQGLVVEKRQFDPWGDVILIQDGLGNNLLAFTVIDRGFTGHEHLLDADLIHMNGRLYDPKLHRFLSPDNFVQDAFNTLNYNRFAYAMNNPLMFTDPNGEFLHILIGAVIGGAINLTIKLVQGKVHNLKDGLVAFGIGAVAGGAAAATGGAALAATGLTGTSVIGGAVAGLAGSAVASPIQGIGNNLYFGDPYSFKSFGKDLLIGAAGGAIVGGTTALFKGKNIWWGNAVAEGRNQFSFNNTAKWNITAENAQIVAFDDIASPDFDQVDLTVNAGKQANHYGQRAMVGKSYLTVDPKELTNQLNKGDFINHGINHRGMNIVKFNQDIGNVLNLSGQNLGATPYGIIHINAAGKIHIVPWLPKN